jgi:hypothetical protein
MAAAGDRKGACDAGWVAAVSRQSGAAYAFGRDRRKPGLRQRRGKGLGCPPAYFAYFTEQPHALTDDTATGLPALMSAIASAG